MSPYNESSHAINIANFRKIVDRCNEFGEKYNPANPDITIASMTAKWTAVSALHSDYLLAWDNTKLPIEKREHLFDQFDKIVRRTIGIFESTKAIEEAKVTARGFVRKITGSNVKVKKLPGTDTPDPKRISNSHQSYLQRVDNFEQLINIYKNDGNYAANEEELKIASLEALLEELKTANYNVDVAVTEALIHRNKRNHGLYDKETGMLDIAILCKKYVKGLFGPRSVEAKTVTGIYLKRFVKM
jgi:hypothetical protein